MSELLNSLNVPSEQPAKSWAAEVSEVATSEPAEKPSETVSTEPAPVEPEAKEAAVESPQPQETASEEPDRRVPLKALQEERQKRAQYEAQLAEYQRREAEWQNWAAQQQQMMQPQQEEFNEPDPETDPIGALKYTKEQLRQMQEMTLQQQEAIAQQQYVAQLQDVAYQAATAAQKVVPDYQDAYKYAINSRAQELMALGTPQHAVPQILQQEEMRLIDTAVRNGRNPAQAIYEFAKARGFQGKTAAPAPAAAPDPVMAQAKAAVAASASAGGAPASKGSITPADLANLNGAAFDSAWNKLFGGNKSSIFRE